MNGTTLCESSATLKPYLAKPTVLRDLKAALRAAGSGLLLLSVAPLLPVAALMHLVAWAAAKSDETGKAPNSRPFSLPNKSRDH